jgi:hypothetical protein
LEAGQMTLRRRAPALKYRAMLIFTAEGPRSLHRDGDGER